MSARRGPLGGYRDGYPMHLDAAYASGDTNSVLASRSGDAVVIDATKTVALTAGAWFAWELRDATGRHVDWPQALTLLLGFTVLPPGGSDIDVGLYVAAGDPDPAAATTLAWGSLRWTNAQNLPDLYWSGSVATGVATSATQLQHNPAMSPYLNSGVESVQIKQTNVRALDVDSETVVNLTGNVSLVGTAPWYCGIVFSPRSGAGSATDGLTVALKQLADMAMV